MTRIKIKNIIITNFDELIIGIINEISWYITEGNEVGVHIKMGVVYAVIIVAAFLWMALMGMNDVQTVFPELQKYFNSIGGCS